jgi:tetratricopeptide (TPR) repeat protein
MSKRFANLEFNDENRKGPDPRQDKRYDADHYLQQAQQACKTGQFEQALQMYTRCLEHNRALIPAWVGQVQMLVQLGEFQEARLWADKALELFRDNGELLAAKAQACARLKDNRAAMACSDGSLQAPGSSAWRWIARGDVLLCHGQDYYDACFQKAVNEPDANWFDRVLIARIYMYYRRSSNAMYYLKQAQQLEPADPYLWFESGNCQVAMGLIGGARACYERCLELRPKFRPAVAALDALGQMTFKQWLKTKLRMRPSK